MQNMSQQNMPSSNYLKSSRKLAPLKGFGNSRVPTQNLSESDAQSTVGLTKKPRKGYELADYTVALEHLNSLSYTKKTIAHDGQAEYEHFEICSETQELKSYGLGIYLYLEFVKRLAATFLIMSSFYILPIVYAYMNGIGLKDYKESYMITLAKTSLGNIKYGNQLAYMLFTCADILSMLALFVFYLHWRSFHNQAVSQENRSPDILNPVMYSLSVIGFDPKTPNLEKNLEEFVNRIISDGTSVQVNVNQYHNPNIPQENPNKFRFKAYEISAIYNYHGEFSKFVHYDELVEKKEKEKQVMIQTGKSNDEFLKIEIEITELQDELSKIAEDFEPYEAIIHFETIKAKHKFIRFCKNYALIDKVSYALKRFFCCQHLPPQSRLFMGKDALMIKSMNLSRPEQMNWPNLDISGCSRIFRWVFSIIFVLIAILITSSAIALCTLYVSSTSACTNFDVTTELDQAMVKGGQTLYCYCAAHFTEIYTDTDIKSACEGLSNTILYANIMQVGASLVSSISNVLLLVVVGLTSKYVLKPDSKPKEYSFIFVGVLLSNYINASVLPLIMNGDIFGFQSLTYLKFINFIDFSKVAIFKDYTTDWYAVVGPYYMNFLIIAITSPIVNLLITCLSGCYLKWKVKRACQNGDKENPVIQKEANKMITGMEFDLPTEKAIVCLNFIIAIMYSSQLPVLIPITTIYLVVTYFCKKIIILRYSVRVPADEALSQKIITLLPFILLLHFLMGIWSHTVDGVFEPAAFILNFKLNFLDGVWNKRIFTDLLMSGAAALVAIWIIFDYTIINFFSLMSECCAADSDEIVLPNDLASKENKSFRESLKKANIQGSYKLVNHPTYGHAIKAYNELRKRKQKELMRKTATMRDQESSQANSSPMKFGQRTTDTFDIRGNNEIGQNEQINQSQIQQQNYPNQAPPPINSRYTQNVPQNLPPNYQPMQNTSVGQPPVQQQNGPAPMFQQQTGQPMMSPGQQQYGYQGGNPNMGGAQYQGGYQNQGGNNYQGGY